MGSRLHAGKMDTHDLFRRLGAGTKFDFQRFGKDAERFKVLRPQPKKGSSDPLTKIDFFSSGTHDIVNDEDEESDLECEQDSKSVKRKLKDEGKNSDSSQKKMKKKDKTSGVTEDESIQWISSSEKKPGDPKEGKDQLSVKRLKQLHQEKINQARGQNKIHVHGTDIPDPVCTFDELQKEYQLDSKVLQNILTGGYESPTPIQMQAIPVMMHKREILACAPTGSGKTVAFCLPVITNLRKPVNKGFRALVISPTRELAHQTYKELLRLVDGTGLRVHIIKKKDTVQKQGPKSKKVFDILVSTPNRLLYLLNQDQPALDLSKVEWLVVDESDKLFEDGKTGFREQLAAIFQACSSPALRRAFFSATCAPDVEKWCKLNLDNLVVVNIGARNSAAETVEQELLFVGAESGKLLAFRNLIKKGLMPPVLVFVQSIERARELFHELVYEGINVDVIHADRTQQQRENVVKNFRSGKIWVLICTALLARGIDFKGVNLVVNYDFPTSAIEYIHRIGRTGRAGHKGKAITFFTEDDKPLIRSIATVIKQAGCPVPDYMVGFKKLETKQKRQLLKNPPKRQTIRTTPRFLTAKNKGKKRKRKGVKKADGKKTEAGAAAGAPKGVVTSQKDH
ncbi:probable ATP-dependent RNA helicase DDX52 [Alosa sapidissima]|uniref:probable ATP-dependent RNA helicase DDX52 n=1 Tax=Alosa sapidissima TaxID=34773 RepID=UPI001C09F265|nr:probable ATP-dependent RNA helicase DDX52 [Alosa sapidissima]